LGVGIWFPGQPIHHLKKKSIGKVHHHHDSSETATGLGEYLSKASNRQDPRESCIQSVNSREIRRHSEFAEEPSKSSETRRRRPKTRRSNSRISTRLSLSIIIFIPGRGAVRVPNETIGLHLDFAKAQYGGHMGARHSLRRTKCNNRKFAMLNLPRMKFYNPRLDIKVFRRPWAGRKVQKTYPCTATILKCISPK